MSRSVDEREEIIMTARRACAANKMPARARATTRTSRKCSYIQIFLMNSHKAIVTKFIVSGHELFKLAMRAGGIYKFLI